MRVRLCVYNYSYIGKSLLKFHILPLMVRYPVAKIHCEAIPKRLSWNVSSIDNTVIQERIILRTTRNNTKLNSIINSLPPSQYNIYLTNRQNQLLLTIWRQSPIRCVSLAIGLQCKISFIVLMFLDSIWLVYPIS